MDLSVSLASFEGLRVFSLGSATFRFAIERSESRVHGPDYEGVRFNGNRAYGRVSIVAGFGLVG